MSAYTNDIEGWTSLAELQWLYLNASRMTSIVEIGSWMGRSTHALLTGTSGHVFAVDHFQGSEGESAHQGIDPFPIFWDNVGMFENLTVLKMPSIEAASEIDRVDMVFIDGAHTYEAVLEDIDTWFPKARKLLCGHDYNWTGVQKAVNQRFKRVQQGPTSIWYVELNGGVKS